MNEGRGQAFESKCPVKIVVEERHMASVIDTGSSGYWPVMGYNI